MKLGPVNKPRRSFPVTIALAAAVAVSALSVSCKASEGIDPPAADGAGIDPPSAKVHVLEANPAAYASALREAVAKAGAANLAVMPNGGWCVRATEKQLAELRKDGLFTSAREYAPSDKGTPPAKDAAPAVYVVTFFPDVDAAAVRAAVAALPGCEVVSRDGEAILRVQMGLTGFLAAAGLCDVQAISEWREPSFDTLE